MSNSIEGTVNAALALQNQAMMQQKNNLMLRKALDNQTNLITSLVQGATQGSNLASGGAVGTLLHTTA